MWNRNKFVRPSQVSAKSNQALIKILKSSSIDIVAYICFKCTADLIYHLNNNTKNIRKQKRQILTRGAHPDTHEVAKKQKMNCSSIYINNIK